MFCPCLQIGDIKALLDKRTQGASLYGATQAEKMTVIGGKLAHYGEEGVVTSLNRCCLTQASPCVLHKHAGDN